jgi:uncharacterized membrane protein YgcG
MRKLQGIQIAGDAYAKIAGIDVISKTWTLKNVMGLSDNEILEQYRMRKLEAAHEYEIAQITNAGPNWKTVTLMQQAGIGAEGGADAGGGMDMGGGMDFGGGDLGGGGDMGGGMDAAADGAMDTLESNPGGGMEEL